MTKEHSYAYESGYQDGLRASGTVITELRDLCGELLENLMPELCGKAYWLCMSRDWHGCNDSTCGNRDFVLRAQSLGVDVDGG